VIAARLTGSRCQCASCGELFNSVSVFNRHRVGGWENRGTNRHCLTIPQLQAKGWSLNARFFWIERSRIDKGRRSGDFASPLALSGEGL
jgi:hypothetical protein